MYLEESLGLRFTQYPSAVAAFVPTRSNKSKLVHLQHRLSPAHSEQFAAALCMCLEVLITLPLLALLDQFGSDFPGFSKVGTGHNQNINLESNGFLAVTKSVHLLKSLKFQAIFVDEAHHPLPSGMPKCKELYRFSATHTEQPDFCYTMGQAIDDGVLCDYDITVPAVTQHHAYVCLADLLVKQAERFRRVLAYCNRVGEAKRFLMVLEKLGLAAWHINARTSQKGRIAAIEEFSGDLTKPVHVMVTVEVLGEGINIPNADTCMFVEPRNSYRSVIQAIGRVLRHHPGKTLAHIVLPAVAVPANVNAGEESSKDPADPHVSQVPSVERHQWQHEDAKASQTVLDPTPMRVEMQQQEEPSADFAATARGEGGRNKVIKNASFREPFPLSSSSHGWHQNLSGTMGKEELAESLSIRRGRQRESQQSERLVEAQSLREGKRDGAAKGERHEVFPHQLSPSLDLSSADAQALPNLHAALTGSAALEQSPDQYEKFILFGKERDALHANHPVRASQVAQHQGVADQPSSARASVGHVKSRSSNASPVVRREGFDHNKIYWGLGIQTNGQQADGSQMVSAGRLDSGNVASTRRLASAKPDRIDQGQGNRRGVRLKSSGKVSNTSDLFSSQLERFLSLLVQADSRLVGSTVGHRIQLVDCRLTVEGELGSWSEEVYSQLTAILRQADPWVQRLRNVEDFAAVTGRLPRKDVKDRREKTLGSWLYFQRAGITRGQLGSRFQSLLNSSSALLRQRVEGWISKDPNCGFKRQCLQLKGCVEMYSELPFYTKNTPRESLNRTLAKWLNNHRTNGIVSNPRRRAMLESVHPLVAELVAKWDSSPPRTDLPKWRACLSRLVNLVETQGRLPQAVPKSSERSLYDWFRRQLGGLEQLPNKLVDQLCQSHPLIAAAVHAQQQRV